MVHFKYERLGIFCFMCGVIGHTEHFCEKYLALEHDDGVRGWGADLRAYTRRLAGGGGGRKWLRKEGGDLGEAITSDPGNLDANPGENQGGQSTNLKSSGVMVPVNKRGKEILEDHMVGTRYAESKEGKAPVLNVGLPLTICETNSAMDCENQGEKKRRIEIMNSTSHAMDVNENVVQQVKVIEHVQVSQFGYFLSAGPSFQACQKP